MIGRKPTLVTENIARAPNSADSSDSVTSPRSPLEITKIQSPKGPKKYNFGSGVGLGIIVALEKVEQTNKPIFNRNLSNRSNEEDYTFVTCHGPNKNIGTTTRVYYDDINIGFDTKSLIKHPHVAFEISPARFSDDVADFPDPGFLSCCHLCRKQLDGKDIYMYRGEKAFCSSECRDVEMEKDMRKEKQQCNSKLVASRSNVTRDRVSTNSRYVTNRRIFATGILAA